MKIPEKNKAKNILRDAQDVSEYSCLEKTYEYLTYLGKKFFTGKVTIHLQHGTIKKVTEEKEVHIQ